MKKIISFALVLALIFSLAACGKKKNSDIEVVKDYESQPVSGDSEGGQKTALNLTSAYNFVNSYAWVKSSGSESYSLIDTSGKIICTSTAIEIHDMSNDACYVKEKVGDKDGEAIYNYKIINKDGKIVASSTDGKFDEILAAGDNLFFVHKYESSIDVSRHLYGTINEKGEFVNQLKEYPFDSYNHEKFTYFGVNAFGILDYYFYSDHSFFYMPCNGNYYRVDDGYDYTKSKSSKLYFKNSNFEINGVRQELPYSYISISSDGKVEEAPEFDMVINDMLIKKNSDNDSLSFTDPSTGKTSVFSKYNVSEIYCADNNFLLKLNGKDGNKYFTVIDKNCNMLFEPVMGTGAEASDGRLVLRTDDGYSVLDYTGKVIIPAGTYSSIDSFNSGIAWAKNSSDQYVGIDVNGKVVIS